MKPPPTKADRLLRLKRRLGWRPRTFHTRIRLGGWIKLPPGLGEKAGDLWAIELLGKTLVLRRVAPGERTRRKEPGWKPHRNLAAALLAMPDAGRDDDFARAADIQKSKWEGLK